MKRKIFYIASIFLLLCVWYGESRKFISLDGKNFITVWKTYNDVCYIIPDKYYGLLPPTSRNFIKTSNLSDLDIIWQNNFSDIIAYVDDTAKIINQAPDTKKIIDYRLNKNYYDSLLTHLDNHYRKYKKGTTFVSIFLKENYYLDNNGKKH